MKRYLCIFISIVLLFSMFPLHVFASEETSSEYDELIELACEVFPEYASAIRGENVLSYSRNRSVSNPEVIYRETRSISDTESLGITQYSSGNVIVVKCDFDSIDLTVPSSTTTDITTVGVAGTASFEIASYGYSFRLSDVGYTIYYYSDKYFTNYGRVTSNSFYSYGLSEQSSSKISYYIRLTNAQTAIVYFDLYFSNNQLVARLT